MLCGKGGLKRVKPGNSQIPRIVLSSQPPLAGFVDSPGTKLTLKFNVFHCNVIRGTRQIPNNLLCKDIGGFKGIILA